MYNEICWAAPAHCIGSHRWVDCSNGDVPEDAVKGGLDEDGGTILIGRAIHEGDILPAKVCPRHGCAFVSYNMEEISKMEYQVLCSDNIVWKPTEFDNIPDQAIQIGRTADGEPLYSGRTYIEGHLTPGKVHPSHRCCYIPFRGQERSYTEYEILMLG